SPCSWACREAGPRALSRQSPRLPDRCRSHPSWKSCGHTERLTCHAPASQACPLGCRFHSTRNFALPLALPPLLTEHVLLRQSAVRALESHGLPLRGSKIARLEAG